MVIKTSVSVLENAIVSLRAVLADRLMGEDMKNLIFWYRDNVLKLVANNIYVTCLSEVSAEVEGFPDEENTLIGIKAKELFGVLDAYKSLKRTKATDIIFEIDDARIKMTVSEEPISDTMSYAEKYYKTATYYLSKVRLAERIRNDIISTATIPNGSTVSRSDVTPYFDALVPFITKDTRDSVATRMYFINNYVYTTPNKFVAIMKNSIGIDSLSEFVATSTVAQFMQSFFALCEVTQVAKKEQEGFILLSLSNEVAEAVIKVYNSAKAFNLSKYLEIPNEGVGVDKYFLIDTLKRASLANEDVTVTLEPNADMKITSKSFSLEVPVLVSRFTTIEKCCFSISAELLSNLIFSHIAFLGDLTFIYIAQVEDTWEITVTDNTKLEDGSKTWWSKVRLRQKRG